MFHGINGEIQEVLIKPDSRRAGSPIRKLKLSRDSLVAAVYRNGQVVVPTGEYVLQEGDRLAVYCLPEIAEKIRSAF